MSDVKRYAVYDLHLSQGGGHEIEEDNGGDWVTYDDYAKLQTKLDECLKCNEEFAVSTKYDKAEVARLRALKDALAGDKINLVSELRQVKAHLAKADVTAIERILNERGRVFDAMVEAAEDAAGKDVSFNVVVGLALRVALAELKGGNNE
jgi:hypothetical protein